MHRLIFIFLALQIVYLSFTSCKKVDERITDDSAAILSFDTDSVIFDTVFSNTLSVSRTFKVYNNNKNAVKISSITIGQQFPSNFKIIVDGIESNSQKDVFVRGKDSLLIIVKALINPQDKTLPYVIDENVEFVTNGNTQTVKIVAWGQDAYFHYSDSITTNTTWPSDKPHVVFDYVKVNKGTTLTIPANTKIYMHGNALLYVQGNIKATGTYYSKIEFRDDRLQRFDRIEQNIEDMPGYWYGILFDEGSTDNEMDWVVIDNAQWGVRLGTPDSDTVPDLKISNSYISNISTVGILGYTSDIYAYNCVVTTCAQSCVAGMAGGNYTFINCTFANGSHLFNRKTPGVVFADYILDANDQPILINDLNMYFYNNIVWGEQENEFTLSDLASAGVTKIEIANNLIKTTETAFNVNDNILNQDPLFEKINGVAVTRDIKLKIKETSPARDKAIPVGLLKDIDDKQRELDKPDMGAYEY